MIDKAEYGIQEVDPKGTALILDGQRPATKMRTGQEPSVPYELRPPKWITKATRDGDLGEFFNVVTAIPVLNERLKVIMPFTRHARDRMKMFCQKRIFVMDTRSLILSLCVYVYRCGKTCIKLIHFKGELWQGTDTFGGIFKQQDKNGLESLQDIMERVLAKRAELHATVE